MIVCLHLISKVYKYKEAKNKALRKIFKLSCIINVNHIYKDYHIIKFKDLVKINAYKCIKSVYLSMAHNIIHTLFILNNFNYNLSNNIVFILLRITNNVEKLNQDYIHSILLPLIGMNFQKVLKIV